MRRLSSASWRPALVVAFLRVYAGTHYASNPLGGALIEIAVAAVVRSVYSEGTRADRPVTGVL